MISLQGITECASCSWATWSGRTGREAVAASLPKLREALRIDLAVVNAENASHGFGLAPTWRRRCSPRAPM